jgi:hypothetical protein
MNDPFADQVRKFTLIMVLVSIIALIFMPLLPWTSISAKGIDKTQWYYEGMLIQSGESEEDSNTDSKTIDATIGLKNNLGLIGLSFWLTILFGIIIIIGIGIYKMGQKYQLFGHIFFLTGIAILIFGILSLIGHVWFIGNVGTLSDEAGKNVDYVFSFNYIPLIMSIILLIISIIYTIKVVPASIAFMGSLSRQNRMRYQQQYAGAYQQAPPQNTYQQPPQQQRQQQTSPPPQQQTQDQKPAQSSGSKFCPKCGTKITGSSKFCTNCGNPLK